MPKNKLSDMRPMFGCTIPRCKFKTDKSEQLIQHLQDMHECSQCCITCNDKSKHFCFYSKSDVGRVTGEPENADGTPFFKRISSSFRDLIGEYEFVFIDDYNKLQEAVDSIQDQLHDLIASFLVVHKGVKVKQIFYLRMKSNKTQEIVNTKYESEAVRCCHPNFIKNTIDFNTSFVQAFITLIMHEISGMTLERVDKLGIIINKYSPKLCRGFHDIPFLWNRFGLVNIHDETGQCFELSVLCSLFAPNFSQYDGPKFSEATGNERLKLKRLLENPATYQQFRELRPLKFVPTQFDGMDINLADEFEIDNDISLGIYKYNKDDGGLTPYRQTKRWCKDHVNLLLIEKTELPQEMQTDEAADYHFVCITDILSFLNKRSDGYTGICKFCSQPYRRPDHEVACFKTAGVDLKFPQDSCYKFKEHHKLVHPPVCIYFSFIYGSEQRPNYETGMKIIGFASVGINANGEKEFECVRVAEEDVVNPFYTEIICRAMAILEISKEEQLPLNPTEEENENLKTVTECYSCLTKFDGSDRYPTRHHQHHKIGPVTYLCNVCNVNAKPKEFVPCFMHDFTNVGARCMIMQSDESRAQQTFIIPKGSEGITAISLFRSARLMDSKNHMNKSIPELAEMLTDDDLHLLRKHVNDDKLFPYVRKGLLFPHTLIESMDDWKKTSLGSSNYYEVSLGRSPTAEEFQTSAHVLSQSESLLHYARLVLFSNVYITTAAMNVYTEWTEKNFQLVPLWDPGLPSYAFSLAHYISKCDYQFIKSKEIIKLIQENLIGGISVLNCKHATAHTERLGHTNVTSENRIEILSVDFNLLYLHCCDDYLPWKDYKILSKEELAHFNPLSIKDEDGYAYGILCTLDYPNEIREKTSSFPLVPTKIPFAVGAEANTAKSTPGNGLQVHIVRLDQRKKENVFLHHRFLQLMVKLGMKIESIDTVLQYKTKKYLTTFVKKCEEVRNTAETKLHKTLAKNIGNFSIGKHLQKENAINVKLVADEEIAEKMLSDPAHISSTPIHETLALLKMHSKKAFFDKNIILGWHVLSISKLKLYDAFYNHLVPVFGNRIEIMSINTDNFLCKIRDPEKTFTQDLNKISILEKKSDHHIAGMLKNEHPYATSFVALNKRCYSILSACGDCLEHGDKPCETCERKQVVKGISKQMEVSHQNLIDVLYGATNEYNITRVDQKGATIKKAKMDLHGRENDDRIWESPEKSYPIGFFD